MKLSKSLLVALCTLGSAFSVKSALADGTQFTILGKCMDVPSWNVTNGTKIDLWACNGGSNQEWIWDQSDGTIRPVFNTSKCLDLPSWETADGTQIEIWDCNGGSNQQWSVQSDDTIEGYGGKRIDVPGGDTTNGTIFDYWDWGGGNNQVFRFENGDRSDVRYCTEGAGAYTYQDWAQIDGDAWFRVRPVNGTEVACGDSCTYFNAGNPFGWNGNYSGCSF